MDKVQPNSRKYSHVQHVTCYIREILEMSFRYPVLKNQGASPNNIINNWNLAMFEKPVNIIYDRLTVSVT